jgi:hypothetical protein
MQADGATGNPTVPVDPDRTALRPLRTTRQPRRLGRSGCERWARWRRSDQRPACCGEEGGV